MTSKIKVDNIDKPMRRCSRCGATTNISCNEMTCSNGGNLINNVVQVAILLILASGASQTGFGRTGTVDWDTTAKTSSFTAVSGMGIL